MRAELESFEQNPLDAEPTDEGSREVITTQRSQLGLLSTRVRELMSTNKELNESNLKKDKDLDSIVRRINPLRKQIQDLETLQETLLRYIRRKYDRTFIISKLKEE